MLSLPKEMTFLSVHDSLVCLRSNVNNFCLFWEAFWPKLTSAGRQLVKSRWLTIVGQFVLVSAWPVIGKSRDPPPQEVGMYN